MVAAAFFASAVALGVLYSFGVFLQPIAADLSAGTAVSAFFSIASLVYYGLGAPAGVFADRYGPRPIIDRAVVGRGLCATAFADNVWLALMTYAAGAGIGGAGAVMCQAWRRSVAGSPAAATSRSASPPPAPAPARWPSRRSPRR